MQKTQNIMKMHEPILIASLTKIPLKNKNNRDALF